MRAAYLLKVIYKVDVLGDHETSQELGAHLISEEFMQIVFETRMEIDECDNMDSLHAIQTDILT